MPDTPPESTTTNPPPQQKRRPGRPPLRLSIDGSAKSENDVAPETHKAAPKYTAPQQVQAQLIADLSGFYAGVGFITAGFNPLAGQVLYGNAVERATEVVNACKHNKQALKVLKQITQSSDIMKLVIGHGGMIFALLVCFDRIPLNAKNAPMLQGLGYKEVIQAKLPAQSVKQHVIDGMPVMTEDEWQTITPEQRAQVEMAVRMQQQVSNNNVSEPAPVPTYP